MSPYIAAKFHSAPLIIALPTSGLACTVQRVSSENKVRTFSFLGAFPSVAGDFTPVQQEKGREKEKLSDYSELDFQTVAAADYAGKSQCLRPISLFSFHSAVPQSKRVIDACRVRAPLCSTHAETNTQTRSGPQDTRTDSQNAHEPRLWQAQRC